MAPFTEVQYRKRSTLEPLKMKDKFNFKHVELTKPLEHLNGDLQYQRWLICFGSTDGSRQPIFGS